jgi:hypothetical protein
LPNIEFVNSYVVIILSMAQNYASIIFAFYQDNITPNPTYVY